MSERKYVLSGPPDQVRQQIEKLEEQGYSPGDSLSDSGQKEYALEVLSETEYRLTWKSEDGHRPSF
jgi:hypothetical protein